MSSAIFSANMYTCKWSALSYRVAERISYRRLWLARWQKWKRRSIHDSQIAHSIHSRLRVHNSHLVICLAHLTSARSVVECPGLSSDDCQQVFVRSDVGSRKGFSSGGDLSHCVRVEKLSCSSHHCNSYFLVGGVCKPLWIDDRRVGHVGAVDRDSSS